MRKRESSGVLVLAGLALMFILTFGMKFDVKAATIDLEMEANLDQTSAREVLTYVNQFRQSGDGWYWNSDNSSKIQTGVLPALTYDYALEEIAVQRAYEIAVSFDHTRPNGTSCFTCKASNGQASSSENIAAGQRDAEWVFTSWKEENEDYYGQGHRRAILNSGFKTIGIGHVVYQGTHFWVQEFGYSQSGMSDPGYSDGYRTATVQFETAGAYFAIESQFDYDEGYYGYVRDLPEITGYLSTDDTWGNDGLPVPSDRFDSLTWTSDDLSVATIIGNSQFNCTGVGDTVLRCTAVFEGASLGTEMDLTVNPTDIGWSLDIAASVTDVTYSFNGNTPSPTVSFYGNQLTEGKDYTVSYQNNTSATNSAKCIISGKGNFNGSKNLTFKINPADFNSCSFSGVKNTTYTGTAIVPNLSVTYENRKVTDYTTNLSDNVNCGTATMIVTGSGNFTGSKSFTFKILPKSVSDLSFANIETQVYNGRELTPAVEIKNGSIGLVSGEDFEAQYSNNKNAGTANVLITGKGNYQGTKELSFKIEKYVGWKQLNGSWYYFGDDGFKKTGWVKDNGLWYYMNASGVMQKGWLKYKDHWYYLSSAMQTGWVKADNKWYYMNSSGVMQSGWLKDNGSWYYLNSSMQTGWVKVDKKWYYMDGSGKMQTGWVKSGTKWYYMDSSGAMYTGWLKYGNKWYYLNSDGSMATSQWVGNYYIQSDGTMR